MIITVLLITVAAMYLVRYLQVMRLKRNEDRAERRQRLMEETMFRIREADRKNGEAQAADNP
jgi:hypothetical protein